MPACNQKKEFNLRIYFQFTPVSKTIQHNFLKMGANLKYFSRLNHLYPLENIMKLNAYMGSFPLKSKGWGLMVEH